MTRPMKMVWLAALGFAGLYSGSALAATTMVLCNSSIQGDSQVADAKKCIDILAWSWGVGGEASIGTGGPGGGSYLAQVKDLSLTKYVDSSSEDLLHFATTGELLDGVVEFRVYQASCTAGCAHPTPFLTIHMGNARVTSQSVGGSMSDDRPTESITLKFESFSYCYQPPGASGSPQCFAFSLLTMQPISPF